MSIGEGQRDTTSIPAGA